MNKWETTAKKTLKSIIKTKKISYQNLSDKLSAIGIKETPANLANKINRGTFSFTLVLQILKALDLQFATSKDIAEDGELQQIIEKTHEELWFSYADLLEEYVKTYNEIPLPSTVYKGRKIGEWLEVQYNEKKNNKLSLAQTSRLFEIVPEHFEKGSTSFLQWVKKAINLRDYVAKYNELPKQNTVYKKVKIGSWLTNQRHAYNKGALEASRIEMLSSIHPDILKSREQILEERWTTVAIVLSNYVNENNALPSTSTIYQGIKIGQWLEAQRNAYKKGALTKEQIRFIDMLNAKQRN